MHAILNTLYFLQLVFQYIAATEYAYGRFVAADVISIRSKRRITNKIIASLTEQIIMANDGSGDKDEGSSSIKMPELPDTAEVQKTVRSGIRQSVDAANGFLSSLHGTFKSVQGPIHNVSESLKESSSKVTNTAMTIFERRHEFGPHIVIGSGVLVGGIFALRRGRISGALGGALASSAAYMSIYNPVPLDDVPDLIFGKKDE